MSADPKGYGGIVGPPVLTVRKPLVDTDHSWMDAGACSTPRIPVDVFFPPMSAEPLIQQARNICATCPVRTLCREFAIKNDIGHGIWGGTTPVERMSIAASRTSRVEMPPLPPAHPDPDDILQAVPAVIH